MHKTKTAKTKLWRSIVILVLSLAVFATATYTLAQLPNVANGLASAFHSMRYILFAARLVLLCLLFIFWQPLLNWYAPNAKISYRHKLLIFAVLLGFDIVFIFQLPFKGL